MNQSTDKGIDTDYFIYKMKLDLPFPVIFTELDFKNLRKALNLVIFFFYYPKLSSLADYLKGIAKVSNTLKIPLPLPSYIFCWVSILL